MTNAQVPMTKKRVVRIQGLVIGHWDLVILFRLLLSRSEQVFAPPQTLWTLAA
jgi:hypothetical protein